MQCNAFFLSLVLVVIVAFLQESDPFDFMHGLNTICIYRKLISSATQKKGAHTQWQQTSCKAIGKRKRREQQHKKNMRKMKRVYFCSEIVFHWRYLLHICNNSLGRNSAIGKPGDEMCVTTSTIPKNLLCMIIKAVIYTIISSFITSHCVAKRHIRFYLLGDSVSSWALMSAQVNIWWQRKY